MADGDPAPITARSAEHLAAEPARPELSRMLRL